VKFEELVLVRRPVQYAAFYVALLKYSMSPRLFLLLSFLFCAFPLFVDTCSEWFGVHTVFVVCYAIYVNFALCICRCLSHFTILVR